MSESNKKFYKYPSLLYIDTINFQDLSKIGECYVFEKVHGANFAIYINNNSCYFAKRNNFLGNNESFFNSYKIRNELSNTLINSNTNEVIIYGELYGGGIQKDIKYSNEIKFIVFDIFCNNQFLSYENLVQFCGKYNLDYLKPLFQGTLKQCLKYETTFTSNYSDFNELCEGVVIKPKNEVYSSDGLRLVFKVKNEKFQERRRNKISHNEENIDLLEYLNLNRINAYFSKTGDELKIQNITQYAKDIIEDAIIDYKAENKDKFIDMKYINMNMKKYFGMLIPMIKQQFFN